MVGGKQILLIGFCLLSVGCGGKKQETSLAENRTEAVVAPRITFVELGSVNCIPCKMMVPVMAAVEHKYGDQLQVIFHDVKKEPEYGQQYGIRLIPTQVFLDRSGTEIFRHEGFFAEDSIDAFLQKQGLLVK
ncbi:MAG: thioredoxin family protein [Candidatus Neomarinimicrobiota bacterium]